MRVIKEHFGFQDNFFIPPVDEFSSEILYMSIPPIFSYLHFIIKIIFTFKKEHLNKTNIKYLYYL